MTTSPRSAAPRTARAETGADRTLARGEPLRFARASRTAPGDDSTAMTRPRDPTTRAAATAKSPTPL